MEQNFSLDGDARLTILRLDGDLEVQGWDKQELHVEWDDHGGQMHQEGTSLTLTGNKGDVEIFAPFGSELRADGVSGNVQARDLRRVELLRVKGEVELVNISGKSEGDYTGEAILLATIGKDVSVHQAPSLRTRGKIGGDVEVLDVHLVEIEAVRGDLDLRQAHMASIGSVGGDLEASSVSEALRVGNVGGDATISDSGKADLDLGNVGSDVKITGAASVRIGNCGNDAEIRAVSGAVHVGNIGNDGSLTNIGGDVSFGHIGDDAHLLDLAGMVKAGTIGNDLEFKGSLPSGGSFARVGGDATVTLPQTANLSLTAFVGGRITGSGATFDSRSHRIRLIYGEGAGQFKLNVGGDLHLNGGGTPRVAESGPTGGFYTMGPDENLNFDINIDVDMNEFGESMSRLGQDLGQSFQNIFGEMGKATFHWSDDARGEMEEQMRKAKERAAHETRKAAERVRKEAERAREKTHRHEERAREKGRRFYVRVNEREWQMNPEHLTDLLERARQAGLEGVAGALEAVENSLHNLRVPNPPRMPMPPVPPTPPFAPMPPMPPMPPFSGSVPPVPPMPPTSPAPVGGAEASEEEGPNLEAEREAILRMIAEGRISPEEGDMLLEGLGE